MAAVWFECNLCIWFTWEHFSSRRQLLMICLYRQQQHNELIKITTIHYKLIIHDQIWDNRRSIRYSVFPTTLLNQNRIHLKIYLVTSNGSVKANRTWIFTSNTWIQQQERVTVIKGDDSKIACPAPSILTGSIYMTRLVSKGEKLEISARLDS